MTYTSTILIAILTTHTLLLTGCNDNSNPTNNTLKIPATGATLPYTILRNDLEDGANPQRALEVRNGGYGSAATAHPTDSNAFYALTDRGPNATFTGADGKGKLFPTPDYTPRIGLFKITSEGGIEKAAEILLKNTDGNPISGLPNSSALGGTGETPYDVDGNTIRDTQGAIKLDDFGLDGEGLVALKDGSFWVSDEYGPHIVHFNAEGQEIERINPFNNDLRNRYTLPNEFANRRANRGMEGLAVTPDETTLVGIMQSTMYNPSSAVKALDITRIVTIHLETGAMKQYLYKQEKTQNSNSEILALDADTFLVIERDGAFYGTAESIPQKHVYKIDLTTGTELENLSLTTEMTQDPDLGLLIDGKTLEESVLEGGWEALTTQGILPVEKSLVVDMITEVGYPHDKMEGLIRFNDTTLGVLNDDDFATWSTEGVLEQKYLDPAKTHIDGNVLYIVDGLDLKGK